MSPSPKTSLSNMSSYQQRLKFLHVTEEEKAIIREVGPLLMPKIHDILDKFYSHLQSFELFDQYLSAPEVVDHLKEVLHEYFKHLFSAVFDESYIISRRMIGKTHERIGLEPRWYIGAYSIFSELIFAHLRDIYPNNFERQEKARVTLMKAFFLDIQIAVEAYIERYAGELVDASKSLEQKLWMEDRLLSFILTEAGDAIVGLDEHDRISTWSQGAQRIFGYKTSEILDKSLSDLLHQPDIIDELKRTAEEEGSATAYESEWRNKNGQTIHADVTLTILRDNKGIHVGSTLIVRDTTEIRRLANKVKNMEQLAAMTKITAGVAHEIRTPLGVMALTADLLSNSVAKIMDSNKLGNQVDLKKEINELIVELQREVDRLNEIVDHYLVLSRIKQPNKKQVHLKPYLESILSELSSRRSDKDIMFYLNVLDEEIIVNIDTDQFRRAFLNLFENSTFAIQKEGMITIVAKKRDRNVEIAFHDTGIGVPSHQVERLFSAFYTNKPGGTGLGLYLVREIVEAHKGKVTIDSEEGKGTTVTISIPYTEEET